MGSVTRTVAPSLTPVDWDEPGCLSIVLQGPLFQGNMVETANHCRHWREMFPHAEVILAISVTDVVVGRRSKGNPTPLRLASKHADDGHLQIALDVIAQCCDKIGLSEGALPLPPIKTDSPKLNNMNLQIAAAQSGLAMATGRYVLRMRSDMIFLNRNFLEQYAESVAIKRGAAAVFQQRVLISWLYTLNPYTLERMPLHFSDWFHFGLTDDVRKIWDVPSISLTDSLYFRTNPHDPKSNRRERLFNIRLAVEQHVIYNCFNKDFGGDLVLRYNNDLTSVKLAMDILVDNFAICDVARSHCIFDKYAGEFTDKSKLIHCITREDWLAMARARTVDYRVTLAKKIDAARHEAPGPVGDELPRTYVAGHLRTRDGRFENGEIVSTSSNGLLFFGPYATLGRGHYDASVAIARLKGSGTMTLRVTAEGGKRLLAKRAFRVDADKPPDIVIGFSVDADKAELVEVLCDIKGRLEVAVTGIAFAARTSPEPALSWASLRSLLRP